MRHAITVVKRFSGLLIGVGNMRGLSIVAPYLVAAGLPLTLLALSAVFRRFYLLAIAAAIYDKAPLTIPALAVGPQTPVLHIRWRNAGVVAHQTGGPQFLGALRETRALRVAFVMSAVVFSLLSAVTVWYGLTSHGMRSASALGVASINTASALVLVIVFVRIRPIPSIAICLLWIGLQFAVLSGMAGVPWRNVVAALIGGVAGGILVPLPAMVLFARRSLRPLIAGFVPAAGLWIVASAAVAIVLVAIGLDLEGTPDPRAIVQGILAALTGIGVAVWQIRRGLDRRFVFWWTAGVAVLAMAESLTRSALLAPVLGVGINGSLVLVGWALIKYFLRLKARGWMPDEVLHFSGCWFVLGVWTYLLAGLEWRQVHWVLLPFATYLIALYGLLYRLRGRLVGRVPKRLLLLRVFHKTPIDSWLIDTLDDSWRRVGTVDLVVGLDLALRTVNAFALEDFLLGRVHRQFLKTTDEARERLSQLPSGIALDGRFPLNELHCFPSTWRYAVTRLIAEADVVLMDLREMRKANHSVIEELNLVVQRVPLSRIVLLTDDRTDEQVLTATAQSAWSQLPGDSANRVSDPTLDVIRCSSRRSENARSIVASVMAAGEGR